MNHDDELRDFISENRDSNELIVIDWTASWDDSCHSIFAFYEGLSGLPLYEKVTFLSCDIDKLPQTFKEAGVQSLPTFQFIKKNTIVTQFSGADEHKLKETILENYKSPYYKVHR